MALKKDKQKVIGEELSDEKLATMLETFISSGLNEYDLIVRCYRHFRPHDFERVLDMMSAKQLEINPANALGQPFVEYLATHANGEPYVEAIKKRLQ